LPFCLYTPPRSGVAAKNLEKRALFMQREEKLRLSADASFHHCFKHGMFSRLYEANLYWFSHAVKPLKPMLERVKGGEPVIYGGLPITSFEKLLAENALRQAEATEYGWRWPRAAQKTLPEDAPSFDEWRNAAMAEASAHTASQRSAYRALTRAIREAWICNTPDIS
jgi:hypothetical protein